MKNVTSSGKGLSNLFSSIGKAVANVGKVAAVGLTATGTALTAVGKLAVDSYADYEQLAGGVETLFGNSAKTIQKYADSAYQTAGMSANEYMNTVTSFSASLLQGLGGDTAAAAEIANQAVVDMSDNANKMGTDISMIQNAYQGFAKQNYTMLDNLKLGYGGTQAEMARLINDSGVLGDSMEVTAETVNQVSFDKIIEAIHTVQENMGIAGTTSKEAATTIRGSLASVGGAWSNLLTAFAADGWDVGVYVDNLTQTIITAGQNIIPRIQSLLPNIANGITNIVNSLIPYVSSAINTLLPSLIDGATSLLGAFTAVFPGILTTAVYAIPQLFDAAASIVSNIVGALIKAAPALLEAGYDLLVELIDGVINGIPYMITRIPVVVQTFIDGINTNLPALLSTGTSMVRQFFDRCMKDIRLLLSAGAQIVAEIVNGVLQNLPILITSAGTTITDFITTFLSYMPQVLQSGVQTILSIVQGIISSLPQVISASAQTVADFVSTIAAHLPEVIQSAIQLLGEFAGGLIRSIPNLVGQIPQIISAIVNAFMSHDWIGLGADIIKAVAQGIMEAVGTIISAAVSAVTSALNAARSAAGGSGGWEPDGSHRLGLDYVPFDGYLAELHKGEMVLTKDEAKLYRTGMEPIIMQQSTISDGKSDMEARLVHEIRNMREDLRNLSKVMRESGNIQLDIDGREVFRAVRNQARREQMRTGVPAF